MVVKLAYRNLWRNKRRTIITALSIFFALLIANLTRSMQLGTYAYILDQFVKKFSGHIQIQNKNYLRNPNINNLLPYTDKIKTALDSIQEITAYTARLQNGIMAFNNDLNSMAYVIGFEIDKEMNFNDYRKDLANFYLSDSIANNIIKNFHLDLKPKHLTGFYRDTNDISKIFYNLKIEKPKNLIPYIEENCRINSQPLDFQDTNKILIGSKLAEKLKVQINDTIILYGLGYNGSTAVGKFVVKGILKLSNIQLDKTAIFMPLQQATDLFSAYDENGNPLVSYIAVNTIYKASIQLSDYVDIQKVIDKINKKLPSNLKAVGWKKINKEMMQQIMLDNVSGQIMLLIIYFVIAFGVFGTVLMMFNEREKELAILLAIGTKKQKLILSFILEMIIISVFGIILSEMVSLPIMFYLNSHPIPLGELGQQSMELFGIEAKMLTEPYGNFLFVQILVILFIVAMVSLYPVMKISKMVFTKTIRS